MTKEALKLALEALEADPAEMVEDENGHMVFRRIQAIITLREALVNEALDKMAENARELGLDYEPAQPFITHNVEQPYDWSEWVCPDPKGYLMKCCDCGLVHEAEFGVVRYKSKTEREDCDMVDDSNLQAVFRMRRSEQWSPEDTAHRSGGLPMAQPEQEPVAWRAKNFYENQEGWFYAEWHQDGLTPQVAELLYTTPPQHKPLTDEEIVLIVADCASSHQHMDIQFAKAIEAKIKEKNSNL